MVSKVIGDPWVRMCCEVTCRFCDHDSILLVSESSLHNEACCQLIRLCNTKDFLTYSVTALQLLSLFVALTHPKTAYLWLLKQFLGRVASTKTVEGKYALYCLRMLGRPRPAASHKRRYPHSSLEVQSITQHNPHDVTQPMAVPVNLPDGATHYAGCDGIMTVDQFLHQLCLSLDIREPAISGYALYVSSPMSITPHHARATTFGQLRGIQTSSSLDCGWRHFQVWNDCQESSRRSRSHAHSHWHSDKVSQMFSFQIK